MKSGGSCLKFVNSGLTKMAMVLPFYWAAWTYTPAHDHYADQMCEIVQQHSVDRHVWFMLVDACGACMVCSVKYTLSTWCAVVCWALSSKTHENLQWLVSETLVHIPCIPTNNIHIHAHCQENTWKSCTNGFFMAAWNLGIVMFKGWKQYVTIKHGQP